MKKLVVEKGSEVIIYIGAKAEILPDRINVGSFEICNPDNYDIFSVEVIEDGIKPSIYCYNSIDGFYLNPNYVADTTNQEIAELKNKLALMQAALDDLILGGGAL